MDQICAGTSSGSVSISPSGGTGNGYTLSVSFLDNLPWPTMTENETIQTSSPTSFANRKLTLDHLPLDILRELLEFAYFSFDGGATGAFRERRKFSRNISHSSHRLRTVALNAPSLWSSFRADDYSEVSDELQKVFALRSVADWSTASRNRCRISRARRRSGAGSGIGCTANVAVLEICED